MKETSGKEPQSLSVTERVLAGITRRLVGTITGVVTSKPAIALTFDDGPNPDCSPGLLALLDRYSAKATFFMVGETAQRHPDLVHAVGTAGHAIGNHSWDHRSFPLLSGRERRRQIRKCAKALGPHGSRLFRPPYGHMDLRSRLTPFFLGYKVITWDVTAVDWNGEDASTIVNNTKAQLHNGAIVLLHDRLHAATDESIRDRSALLEALETLFRDYGDHYQFVTVPELLKMGRARKRNWTMLPTADWLANKRLAGVDI